MIIRLIDDIKGCSHSRLLSQQIDFEAPVDLWHFYLLRSVGKGAFGKVGDERWSIQLLVTAMLMVSLSLRLSRRLQVRVVQHKQTKALYALKYINKQVIQCTINVYNLSTTLLY